MRFVSGFGVFAAAAVVVSGCTVVPADRDGRVVHRVEQTSVVVVEQEGRAPRQESMPRPELHREQYQQQAKVKNGHGPRDDAQRKQARPSAEPKGEQSVRPNGERGKPALPPGLAKREQLPPGQQKKASPEVRPQAKAAPQQKKSAPAHTAPLDGEKREKAQGSDHGGKGRDASDARDDGKDARR